MPMEFTLGESHLRFRQDVRRFLTSDDMQSSVRKLNEYAPREEPFPDDIYRALGQRRWFAPAWPHEYGGLGAGLAANAIVAEELCWHGVPDIPHVVTVDIVGMFLLLAGTSEQKARYLPGMAAGEDCACVLYSEPDVGSDLSGVRARAETVDGGFRLYGTKLYSLRTADARIGLCVARLDGTDPGSPDGLTLFILPMSEPGLSVHPLYSIADERFGRVELDGVFVPDENVLGTPGDGWTLLTSALAIERTGLEPASKARRWLDVLIARAVETGRVGDPAIAATLARRDAEVETGRLLAWRVIGQLGEGKVDQPAASMSKLYSSEIARRLLDAGLAIDGLNGVLSRWNSHAPAGGFTEWLARETPGVTISAGTSEIMRYVVANTGLAVLPTTDPDENLFDELARMQPDEPALGEPLQLPDAAKTWVDSPAWRRLAASGLLRLAAAPDLGGAVAPSPELAAHCEAAGIRDYREPLLPALLMVELANQLAHPADRAEMVAALASGHLSACLVVDPALRFSPGSDVGWLSATVTDEHVALDGTVRFVHSAGRADQLLVLTGSALLQIPRPNRGVSIRRLDDLGRGDMYEVEFCGADLAGVRTLPLRGSLGQPLARARLRLASYLVGLATGAVEATIAHTRDRRQFGRSLLQFQGVSFPLADLVSQVHGARLFCRYLASIADGDAPLTQRAAQALAMAARLAKTAGTEAMQLHGAIGLTEANPAQRFYRRAVVHGLLLGTPDALDALAGQRLATDLNEAPRFACDMPQ